MVSLALLLACADDAPAPVDPDAIPVMDDVRYLTRLSLDLRGTRPTAEEIERVEADPAALDALRDEYLADDRFGDRVRDLFAETYLTRSELYAVDPSDWGVSDEVGFLVSMGEEPLRILSEIAANDLPYTDLVTGDWTMVDETLAMAWPTDYPEGGEGWQRVRYTDGRPAAGVLATNTMWLRYTSTDSNANRKRANATSRILLCNDYLVRPIEFDRNVNLLDEDAVNDALQNNAACVNCHNSLDPLASYFFGFWTYYESAGEISTYHPERERLWETATGVVPAYYGEPGSSLADLGQQIAADSRFPSCAVEQVFEGLLRRDATLDDTDALVRHREAFLQGGLTLRALFASVVGDARYRAGDTDHALAVPTKMLTPEQLATSIEDLTGFDWSYYGYDMMRSDVVGLHLLAGGTDGLTVTASAREPGATVVLVQERLAEAAATTLVPAERALEPGERRLLTEIDFTETPDAGRAAMVAQIQALHLRIFGTRVAEDGEEVEANLALWQELYAINQDADEAWAGLLTALLRDPDFLLY